MNFVKMLGVMN